MIRYFSYGAKEMDCLSKRCKKMGKVIAEVGLIRRRINPDPFAALVSSVISQQISGKGAATIQQRLLDKCGKATPCVIAALSPEEIQACGMSMRKATYIQGIAEAALNGSLDTSKLDRMTDQELIDSLIRLKGVGIWTAQMLMIFSLGRQDILSWLDLGIRKGLQILYNYPEVSREQFEKQRKKYSPYGSVASLYLWHLAGQAQTSKYSARQSR